MKFGWPTAFGCLALLFALAMLATRSSELLAENPRLVPAPAYASASATATGPQTAIFAGGCFWGVQGVYAHVAGVRAVVSGYAGGNAATAHYEQVGTGRTGHAEAVRIVYDPAKVSYGTLMRIFFSVVADPTTLNAQGPDTGTQYRTAIFPTNPDQAEEARRYIAQLDEARIWPSPIVTRVESGRIYRAEAYHQDFMTRRPNHPYILVNDRPKLLAFKRLFPEIYRERPVLVAAAPR